MINVQRKQIITCTRRDLLSRKLEWTVGTVNRFKGLQINKKGSKHTIKGGLFNNHTFIIPTKHSLIVHKCLKCPHAYYFVSCVLLSDLLRQTVVVVALSRMLRWRSTTFYLDHWNLDVKVLTPPLYLINLFSVEEAKKKIYALSTTTYEGFQVECSEETSNKFQSMCYSLFLTDIMGSCQCLLWKFCFLYQIYQEWSLYYRIPTLIQ